MQGTPDSLFGAESRDTLAGDQRGLSSRLFARSLCSVQSACRAQPVSLCVSLCVTLRRHVLDQAPIYSEREKKARKRERGSGKRRREQQLQKKERKGQGNGSDFFLCFFSRLYCLCLRSLSCLHLPFVCCWCVCVCVCALYHLLSLPLTVPVTRRESLFPLTLWSPSLLVHEAPLSFSCWRRARERLREKRVGERCKG